MTVPFIGEAMALVFYIMFGGLATLAWSINPFLAIIPMDAAISYYLFVPNIQDSCFGYYVGSCRFDRWMGENKWFRMSDPK